MTNFNVGLGTIDIVSEGFQVTIRKRPTSDANIPSEVLFVNHSTDAQYSFEERELNMVHKQCDEYEFRISLIFEDYNYEFFHYLSSRIVFQGESLDEYNHCIILSKENMAKVINIVCNDMDEFVIHTAEKRISDIKTKMNIDDEQYTQMQAHFEAISRTTKASAC